MVVGEELNDAQWIVAQIGAREHYAIPRGLAYHGRLKILITDAWTKGNLLFRVSPHLSGRFHEDLQHSHVKSFTPTAIAHELAVRFKRTAATQSNMVRNEWFQRHVIAELDRLEGAPETKYTLFAYSYAARDIFRYAKARGWATVLGQIDPGPEEARIVERLVSLHTPRTPNDVQKPEVYWEYWREECRLADYIVVNSDWSRNSLLAQGVEKKKIRIVPLAYDAAQARNDPTANQDKIGGETLGYSSERPLRLLFLGQAIIRKGIFELVEAAGSLLGAPVEFYVVGPASFEVEQILSRSTNIRWYGRQPRTKVLEFYQISDVYILPTHSDGFGLTQYEALAYGLPVIASKYCGEVVVDNVNGLVLPEVSAKSIVNAVLRLLEDRQLVEKLAKGARKTKIPSCPEIGARLLNDCQTV